MAIGLRHGCGQCRGCGRHRGHGAQGYSGARPGAPQTRAAARQQPAASSHRLAARDPRRGRGEPLGAAARCVTLGARQEAASRAPAWPGHVTLTRGAPSRRGPMPRGGPSPAARRRRPGSGAAEPSGPTAGDERRPRTAGPGDGGKGERGGRGGMGRGGGGAAEPPGAPPSASLSWRRGRGRHVSVKGGRRRGRGERPRDRGGRASAACVLVT